MLGIWETYVQWQVQAQHIALSKQFVKADILGSPTHFFTQWVAVVVDGRHAKLVHLGLEVTPDTTHTQDTEDLALRIVAEWWSWLTTPFALTKRQHRGVEVAEGANDQENGCVGGGVVDSGGYVGDEQRRLTFCTGVDVDLKEAIRKKTMVYGNALSRLT